MQSHQAHGGLISIAMGPAPGEQQQTQPRRQGDEENSQDASCPNLKLLDT